MKTMITLFSTCLVLLLAAPLSAYIKTTHLISMRDDIRLSTDVYLNENPGTWPTILMRTPYSKEIDPEDQFVFEILTNLGFAVVTQDTRGRFASEGIDSLFLDDGWGAKQDGYDTVEWIAAQAWSNGKVGTFGASALGIAQYMMAGAAPPHLVCQFVAVGATDLYAQSTYYGGVFLKNLVEGWLTSQGSEYLLSFFVSHPRYDATWRRMDLNTRWPVVNVPMYHWGGWHDIFLQGTLQGFTGSQHLAADGARGKQKLVIGPWTHGGWRDTKQGELDFPPNSKLNDLAELLRWFDYWLLGNDNGLMSEPAVKYYVMGAIEDGAPGNEWRTAEDWPPAAQATPFYFHAGGGLQPTPPATSAASADYVYDPRQPVPTIGGKNLSMPAGPFDQRATETRSDVLVFTSAILAEPLEVIGALKVKLWFSSSARDTDFMAKLTDVYPDGRSMLIADGAVRARHRISTEQEDLLSPGTPYECEIDLWSTAMLFNRGHRIRVAISSSNAPRFDPNPNSGNPFRVGQDTLVATNTIYLDATRPSHIVLPITSGFVSVAERADENVPVAFEMRQNYPNPVHHETSIAYVLPRAATVRLAIYNTLGQEIIRLQEGLLPPGKQVIKWHGRDRAGRRVARGIYLYRLQVNGTVTTRKLMLL
ncbi:MAG: CocE/NonD family hydrolase [bacterium]